MACPLVSRLIGTRQHYFNAIQKEAYELLIVAVCRGTFGLAYWPSIVLRLRYVIFGGNRFFPAKYQEKQTLRGVNF